MFSDTEVEYVQTQPLGRLATVDAGGQPDVTPVSYEWDGTHFFIGGAKFASSRKAKNVAVNGKVALVVDDLKSVQPWVPRGIRIYGSADIVQRNGRLGPGSYIRMTPETYWSWGIEAPVFQGGRHVFKKVSR